MPAMPATAAPAAKRSSKAVLADLVRFWRRSTSCCVRHTHSYPMNRRLPYHAPWRALVQDNIVDSCPVQQATVVGAELLLEPVPCIMCAVDSLGCSSRSNYRALVPESVVTRPTPVASSICAKLPVDMRTCRTSHLCVRLIERYVTAGRVFVVVHGAFYSSWPVKPHVLASSNR